MKKCFKCSELLSLDCFYKASAYKDGYRNSCKECDCKYSSIRRESKKEYHKEKLKDWKSKNKDKVNQSQKEWRNKTNYQSIWLSNTNNKLAHYLRTRLSKGAK